MSWLAAKAALSASWRVLAAIPPIVYVGLLALVFALASGHYREQRDEARKQYADHIQADEAALAKAKADAKAAERKQKQAMANAAAQYEQDKAHALAAKNRVIADLRAGTLKLRSQWRGCVARTGAADGAEGSDAAADLRSESAGRIVRAAADADAQVTYLQGLIRSAPACFIVP